MLSKCIVICGGMGTRVAGVTNNDIPKIMISINGIPFVDYLIQSLVIHGVNEIHFAAGFKAEVLERYLVDVVSNEPMYKDWLHLNVVQEEVPRGTGGCVVDVMQQLDTDDARDEFVLVLNGDTLLLPDPSVRASTIAKSRNTVSMCIGGVYLYNKGEYGSLILNGREITGFRERDFGFDFINSGWYLMKQNLFVDTRTKELRPELKFDKTLVSLERDIFPTFIKNYYVECWAINEHQWMEIGTEPAIARTELILRT